MQGLLIYNKSIILGVIYYIFLNIYLLQHLKKALANYSTAVRKLSAGKGLSGFSSDESSGKKIIKK